MHKFASIYKGTNRPLSSYGDKDLLCFLQDSLLLSTRREEIRAVMRYSGPRMMLTAPVATLHHLYLSILHKLKSSNHEY